MSSAREAILELYDELRELNRVGSTPIYKFEPESDDLEWFRNHPIRANEQVRWDLAIPTIIEWLGMRAATKPYDGGPQEQRLYGLGDFLDLKEAVKWSLAKHTDLGPHMGVAAAIVHDLANAGLIDEIDPRRGETS